MLEMRDALDPSEQSTGTVSRDSLPNLAILGDTNGKRNPHEVSIKKNYRVKSIGQMTDSHTHDQPTIFIGGQMGQGDRHELNQFCEEQGIYYYDPDESAPKNPGFETIRETDKTAVLLSLFDIFTIGEESSAGVTLFEIFFDKYLSLGKRLILLVDTKSGEPIRVMPQGIVYDQNGSIDFDRTPKKDLIRCFEKALSVGNLMRQELLVFLKDAKKICTVEENLPGLVRATKEEFQTLKQNPEYTCYEITNNNLHFTDIFKCFIDVLDGKKVAVYFHPPVDQNNFPVMADFPNEADTFIDQKPYLGSLDIPYISNPKGEDLRKIVKQYIREANTNRELAMKELDSDPNTKILYKDQITMQDIKDTIVAENEDAKKRLKGDLIPPSQTDLLQ